MMIGMIYTMMRARSLARACLLFQIPMAMHTRKARATDRRRRLYLTFPMKPDGKWPCVLKALGIPSTTARSLNS
jgi:hypothetical protein